MAENRLIGDYPVIGIRPTIDGRRGVLKVRESLEDQTMNMAKAAAALFEENLRYSNGEPVKVVIADTTIGRVGLPVCTPVIAVLALWQFVAMWNSYFDAMIYLNDSAKQPLQLVLRSILIQNQPEAGMIADMQSTAERAQLAELLKYATIIISSLPLLVMYPFFQKYFDAGIMAGSVKG